MTVLSAGVLLFWGACEKQPEKPKEIGIPASSQDVFSRGISFDSGITEVYPEDDPWTDPGTEPEEEPEQVKTPQTKEVLFTAPEPWVATVTYTKATDWLSVSPTSGPAGDVILKVTAQPNETNSSRRAKVSIKSGGATAGFAVEQESKPIPVSSVSLDKSEITLQAGETAKLVATVKPDDAADKTVTWDSSNKAVATVDNNGNVTAWMAGKATIRAKSGKKSAYCKVTVLQKATSISLDKTTLSMTEGDEVTLKASLEPADATDEVKWSSSNTSVATVDASGKVTAVKEGSATITATAGSVSATCEVTVAKRIIPVASITLNKTRVTLHPGETEILTATIVPENATDNTLTWTSSYPAAVTVDANGKITAVAVGAASIHVSCGGKSATCEVTVDPIAVTSVTLDKTSLSLTEGDSATLTATVKPDNATNKTVNWSSSNTAVATVDANGKVTAVKEGSATITAKAGDKSATCSVTVAKKVVAVTSVSLDKTSLSLTEGDSATLTATVKPDNATNKTVNWSSSNTAVATVDANGKVTAVKEGSATITAKAGDKSATCSVTVAKKVVAVTSVSLNKTSLSLTEGDTATLTATVKPDNATNKTVTWSSSNTAVATVDASGKVTAVKEGSATITAKAGDKTATCAVTVAAKVIAVTSVTLDKTSLSLTEGDSATLTATVKPDNATNKTVTWSSSNTAVATVDANGKVTAVKEGSATITAKAGDKSATCTVTVAKKVIAVTSVTLNKTSLSLTEGDSATLTATVKPDNATDKTVNWSSSNTAVASVDVSGKVTAIHEGEAKITAKAGDKSASCTISVSAKVIAVTSITLDQSSLSLTEGESAKLTATVKPDNATDKSVTWSSSDAAVATVNQSGKVSALKAGTATITAKAGDKTATCAVIVSAKVIAVTSVTLDWAVLELIEGESETLIATVKPDNATDKTVTWSSSDTAVATVDASGKVTALKAGSATVTAKAGDKTATCAVIVAAKVIEVTSVMLDKSNLALTEGESATLKATVKPDNATDKTVTWSSSNTAVATVDASGRVSALRAGTATVTARAGGKSATCAVTVAAKVVEVASVTLDWSSLALTEGESATMRATVKPDNATDKSVTWSSSNAAVATVDQNGNISALRAGSATITAKAGNKTASCAVTVTAIFIEVTSVTLDKSSLTLTEGESATLTATVKPDDATDSSLTWSSNDEGVAVVDNNGEIYAIRPGTAIITARAGDKSASCDLLVKPIVIPTESVSLNYESVDLAKGTSITLVATVFPDDATDKTVTWSSSDATIASVDQNGKVSALKLGSAVITVKTNSGAYSATCTVNVKSTAGNQGNEGFNNENEEW